MRTFWKSFHSCSTREAIIACISHEDCEHRNKHFIRRGCVWRMICWRQLSIRCIPSHALGKACVGRGQCNPQDKLFRSFDRLLTKIPEHTWGKLAVLLCWTFARCMWLVGLEQWNDSCRLIIGFYGEFSMVALLNCLKFAVHPMIRCYRFVTPPRRRYHVVSARLRQLDKSGTKHVYFLRCVFTWPSLCALWCGDVG